jgi:UDP-2-acetamido-2-deoxy-ribo-hexuluronate aminotransferase
LDLLLDVNIVLDICALRDGFSGSAADAEEKCALSGGRVWLYSGSVQTYDYNLRQELRRTYLNKGMDLTNSQCAGISKLALSDFAKDKQWLAALAGEGPVFEAEDPEDEQLIRALQRFGEGKIKILTRDAALIEKCAQAITPEEYLQSDQEPKSIDFIDLKTQQDTIRPELERGIHRALHHGQYIMGPEIKQLEAKLSAYVGVEHAITKKTRAIMPVGIYGQCADLTRINAIAAGNNSVYAQYRS